MNSNNVNSNNTTAATRPRCACGNAVPLSDLDDSGYAPAMCPACEWEHDHDLPE